MYGTMEVPQAALLKKKLLQENDQLTVSTCYTWRVTAVSNEGLTWSEGAAIHHWPQSCHSSPVSAPLTRHPMADLDSHLPDQDSLVTVLRLSPPSPLAFLISFSRCLNCLWVQELSSPISAISHFILHRQFFFTHLIPTFLASASLSTWMDNNRRKRQSWKRGQSGPVDSSKQR